MRLNVVTTPDPAHAGLADPLCGCHRAATPVRASFRLSLQSGVNHGLDSSRIVTGFPAPAGCNLPKRLRPTVAKALAPEANRLTVHAVLSGDHCPCLRRSRRVTRVCLARLTHAVSV